MISKEKIAPESPGDSRVRGRRLQRIREQHFRLHPLCVRCETAGRLAWATQLDHTVALVNGGKDVAENRQGLCDDCHKEKTREDLGQKERPEIGLDGWPKISHGVPGIDPKILRRVKNPT